MTQTRLLARAALAVTATLSASAARAQDAPPAATDDGLAVGGAVEYKS